MATINLRELKRRLPYGSLARIAEATGISAHTVSMILNHGHYPQYHGPVCDAALCILDEFKIDPDVTRHAKEHGLTSAHSIYVPARGRKKKSYHYDRPNVKLTWDALSKMDTYELEAVCDDLGIKLSWFERNLCYSNEHEDDLRERIAIELGIDNPGEEDPDEDEDLNEDE